MAMFVYREGEGLQGLGYGGYVPNEPDPWGWLSGQNLDEQGRPLPHPTWCDWTITGGLSNFFKQCQPIDPRESQQETFGPALTPVSREAALERGDELQEAYLRTNPEAAADFQYWLDWKPVFESPEKGVPPPSEWTPEMSKWAAIGTATVLGVVGLLIVTR